MNSYLRFAWLPLIGPSLVAVALSTGCGTPDSAPGARAASADDAGGVTPGAADGGAAPVEDAAPAPRVNASIGMDAAGDAPAPPSVRACGFALETPLPLGVRTTWDHRTRPIRLGQGTSGRAFVDATYADGAPVRGFAVGETTLAEAGPDLTSPMNYITPLAPPRDNAIIAYFDNLEGDRIGDDELEIPSPTRVTFGEVWAQTLTGWLLAEEYVTPATPATGYFVRSFEPAHYFGFTLSVEFASPCARLAVEDVLGRSAIVTQLSGSTRDTLLDPLRRSLLEPLLVRDGAKLRVAVVSNVPRAAVASLLEQSSCSAADLGACAELIQKLDAQSSFIAATAPDATYDALAGARDPEWSVLEFNVASVVELSPKP